MDKSTHSVGILLIDGFPLMSFASIVEPLRTANRLAGRKLFEVRHMPQLGGQAISSNGALVKADSHVGEFVNFDMVLVLAGDGVEKFNDLRILDWLRNLDRRGVKLGGISGGPFVLAMAGLLNKMRATIHWEHAPTLAEIMPELNLVSDRYVYDERCITCAGGTAPLDMMHQLIADLHGPEFARQISDRLLYTDVRQSAGPQRSGLVERYGTHNTALIKAIELMETNVSNNLALPDLAKFCDLSERQLNRLFREHLGDTAMAFYRKMRLERAHGLLTNSTLPITEIALATGFAGSAHLSKSFKAHYAIPPSELRNSNHHANQMHHEPR